MKKSGEGASSGAASHATPAKSRHMI
jgi:hypothetical protein